MGGWRVSDSRCSVRTVLCDNAVNPSPAPNIYIYIDVRARSECSAATFHTSAQFFDGHSTPIKRRGRKEEVISFSFSHMFCNAGSGMLSGRLHLCGPDSLFGGGKVVVAVYVECT